MIFINLILILIILKEYLVGVKFYHLFQAVLGTGNIRKLNIFIKNIDF